MLDLGTLKIGVTVDSDKATTELEGLKKDTEQTQSKFSTFGETLKSGFKTACVAAAAAIASVGAAFVDVAKKAVDAYSDLEQAQGATTLLFKDFADDVEQNAQLAATNYQMNATDYLNYINGVSGALASGLNNDMGLVAEYGDLVISTAADIASAYGYTVNETMDKLSSIAMGNYQALDTLTAGAFAGTKAGLEELAATASEALGVALDPTNYADVITALNWYNESMGIAGNAAEEAANTIAGTKATMQASWENMLAGLGDESADLDILTSNLIDSVINYLGQIVPRIGLIATNLVQQIPELVSQAGQALTSALPSAIGEPLQQILDTIGQDLTTMGAALTATFQEAVNWVQSLFSALEQNEDVQEAIANIMAAVDLFKASFAEL